MFKGKFLKKLITFCFIVVIAVLLMTVIDKSSLKLAVAYYTLTNKPSRSDLQFNIPTGRLLPSTDGTTDIKFELPILSEDSNITVDDIDATGANGTDTNGGTNTGNNSTGGTKIVSIMGDSISTFDGTIPNGYANFYPSGDVSDLGDMWWKQYIDSTNATLGVNGSWSGSKVTGSDDSAGKSDKRVNDLGANGEPTVIIIYMGTNDLWSGVSQSDFSAAYEVMLNKIKGKYSSAKVYCLGLTRLASDPNTGGTGPLDGGTGDSQAFSSIIQDKASAAGFTYVSLDSCWDYSEAGSYCTDGMVHPNKEGMKKIASKIPK